MNCTRCGQENAWVNACILREMHPGDYLFCVYCKQTFELGGGTEAAPRQEAISDLCTTFTLVKIDSTQDYPKIVRRILTRDGSTNSAILEVAKTQCEAGEITEWHILVEGEEVNFTSRRHENRMANALLELFKSLDRCLPTMPVERRSDFRARR